MKTVSDNLHRDGSGRVLIDATADLLITLRREDGKDAVQCDQGHCAFAEAAKREYPALVEIKVSRVYTRLCFPEHVVRYRNSLPMRRQIQRFDESNTFETGQYLLLAVSPSDRLGVRRSAQTGPHKTKRPVARDIQVNTRPTTWSFSSASKRRGRGRAA